MNKSNLADKWLLLRSFIYTRWGLRFNNREKLLAWQTKALQRYFKTILPTANFYANLNIQTLEAVPLMDKASMMDEFAARNSAAISREQAMAVALQAEQSRDFNPTISHPQLGELTVGMSSGTSGQRGLFLVSHQERLRWAGILLAKTLPSKLLQQVLCFWRRPLSIAFFLRANSNLYNTLGSSRIDFSFYDLLQGVDKYLERLNQQQPHALVAPATVLRRLAELQLSGRLIIQPLHILSVAEVLEPDDAALIERAFAQKPQQIYQATEGFLGYSCERGNLHLNESHLVIEKQWLDATRFQPLITDFSRSTQIIARYSLNDILRVASEPCPCGRAELCIAEIEGRADQILWLHSQQSAQPSALFPDLLRRTMMLVEPPLQEYSILQKKSHWQIALPAAAQQEQQQKSVATAIANLCGNLQLQMPELSFCQWQTPAAGVKRRRIICAEGLQ